MLLSLLLGLALARGPAPVAGVMTKNLDPAQVRTVLDAGRRARAACVSGGGRAEDLSLRFLVEADGRVSHPTIQSSLPPAARACVEGQLATLRFPKPADGLGMVAVGGHRAPGSRRGAPGPDGRPPCRVSRWAFATATAEHCAARVMDPLWALYPRVRACVGGRFAGALPVQLTLEDGAVTRVGVEWGGLSEKQRACLDTAGRTLAAPGVSGTWSVDYLMRPRP